MSSDEKEKVGVLTERIEHLTERIDDLMERLKTFEAAANQRFVSQAEFWPVKTLVYGAIGIILAAVMGAIVALVLR